MSNQNINTGGAAFPVTEENGANSGDFGMTLRDYFAAKAMQAIISTVGRNGEFEYDDVCVARSAYMTADAMLAERSK